MTINRFKFEEANKGNNLDRYYSEQFSFGSDPRIWQYHALQFKRAADHIFNISLKGAEKIYHKFFKSIKNGKFKNGEQKIRGKELEWQLDSNLNRIYYMLIGLALEISFKGLLIRKDATLVTPQNGFSKKLETHNLVQLAKHLDYPIDNDTKFMFENLIKDVTWRAKYPVPKKVAHLRQTERFAGANNLKDANFPGYDLLNKVFNDLLGKYEE